MAVHTGVGHKICRRVIGYRIRAAGGRPAMPRVGPLVEIKSGLGVAPEGHVRVSIATVAADTDYRVGIDRTTPGRILRAAMASAGRRIAAGLIVIVIGRGNGR